MTQATATEDRTTRDTWSISDDPAMGQSKSEASSANVGEQPWLRIGEETTLAPVDNDLSNDQFGEAVTKAVARYGDMIRRLAE